MDQTTVQSTAPALQSQSGMSDRLSYWATVAPSCSPKRCHSPNSLAVSTTSVNRLNLVCWNNYCTSAWSVIQFYSIQSSDRTSLTLFQLDLTNKCSSFPFTNWLFIKQRRGKSNTHTITHTHSLNGHFNQAWSQHSVFQLAELRGKGLCIFHKTIFVKCTGRSLHLANCDMTIFGVSAKQSLCLVNCDMTIFGEVKRIHRHESSHNNQSMPWNGWVKLLFTQTHTHTHKHSRPRYKGFSRKNLFFNHFHCV